MKKSKRRDWLINIRKKRMKSQDWVSIKAEISRTFYTNIELGIKNPSLETQYKISKALKFNPRLFVDNVCSFEEQKESEPA